MTSVEMAVDRHGYREYDNPLTGRGLLAANGVGSSTLRVDLLAQCGNDVGELSATRPIMAA